MAIEKTFSIIKPNSTLDNNIGNIIAVFEKQGLRVAAAKFTKLSKEKQKDSTSSTKSVLSLANLHLS